MKRKSSRLSDKNKKVKPIPLSLTNAPADILSIVLKFCCFCDILSLVATCKEYYNMWNVGELLSEGGHGKYVYELQQIIKLKKWYEQYTRIHQLYSNFIVEFPIYRQVPDTEQVSDTGETGELSEFELNLLRKESRIIRQLMATIDYDHICKLRKYYELDNYLELNSSHSICRGLGSGYREMHFNPGGWSGPRAIVIQYYQVGHLDILRDTVRAEFHDHFGRIIFFAVNHTIDPEENDPTVDINYTLGVCAKGHRMPETHRVRANLFAFLFEIMTYSDVPVPQEPMDTILQQKLYSYRLESDDIDVSKYNLKVSKDQF